ETGQVEPLGLDVPHAQPREVAVDRHPAVLDGRARQAGLLGQLAPGRRQGRLAGVDAAARRLPHVGAADRVVPVHEQHSAVPVQADHSGGGARDDLHDPSSRRTSVSRPGKRASNSGPRSRLSRRAPCSRCSSSPAPRSTAKWWLSVDSATGRWPKPPQARLQPGSAANSRTMRRRMGSPSASSASWRAASAGEERAGPRVVFEEDRTPQYCSIVIEQFTQDIGHVGVWHPLFGNAPGTTGVQAAVRAEELGYGSVWVSEGPGGKDPFVAAALLLAGTSRIAVGTGIASIWSRDAAAMAGSLLAVGDAFPGRFVAGPG